jgi:hypothetical protein
MDVPFKKQRGKMKKILTRVDIEEEIKTLSRECSDIELAEMYNHLTGRKYHISFPKKGIYTVVFEVGQKVISKRNAEFIKSNSYLGMLVDNIEIVINKMLPNTFHVSNVDLGEGQMRPGGILGYESNK